MGEGGGQVIQIQYYDVISKSNYRDFAPWTRNGNDKRKREREWEEWYRRRDWENKQAHTILIWSEPNRNGNDKIGYTTNIKKRTRKQSKYILYIYMANLMWFVLDIIWANKIIKFEVQTNWKRNLNWANWRIEIVGKISVDSYKKITDRILKNLLRIIWNKSANFFSAITEGYNKGGGGRMTNREQRIMWGLSTHERNQSANNYHTVETPLGNPTNLL